MAQQIDSTRVQKWGWKFMQIFEPKICSNSYSHRIVTCNDTTNTDLGGDTQEDWMLKEEEIKAVKLLKNDP